MELIKRHTNLLSFLFQKTEHSDFSEIFQLIKNNEKVKFASILRYVDCLLRLTFDTGKSEIKTLHINFSTKLSCQECELIAEYLLLKFHIDNVKNKSKDLEGLENEIQILTNRINNFCYPARKSREYPNGISTIEYNQIIESHKKNKALVKFYKSFNKKLRLKLLFNSTTKQMQSLKNYFEYCPIAIELNDSLYSSNLLNSDKTLNDIDGFNSEIINKLESILLFDCERKSIMKNFSFDEINKWNSEYDTNFRQYLIITFGEKLSSINSIRNKIELISERFKVPANTSYSILSSEIDFLLNKKSKSYISIDFEGFESSSFWDTFVLETSIRELYELRSIKLMNIYSICYTDDIKAYILENIFSKKDSSELISTSAKIAILELRDDDIEKLKDSLSHTLDLIIKSNIKSKIIERLSNTPIIIIDEAILKNARLLSKITTCLGLTKSIKLKTWSDLLNFGSNYFLILSYRDQGIYPNYYYPNLQELELDSEKTVSAILPNFLFGHHYNWSKYYLLKEYYKLLTHSIRESHFEWNKLRELIQALKPESKLIIDWDLENEYYYSTENRETYKVKMYNQRVKTYHSSDFLIYSEINSEKPRIERMKWFSENIDSKDSKYKIQKLDELLDEFNPAERLIDTTRQEKEIEIIRKELGLENESAGSIWKVLLKKKVDLFGVDTLYEELKLLFTKNNIPLVKQSYFINSWLNIESDTLIPRGNKVAKVLFEYLKLSNNYRLILYRLKNASISGKIEATKKYSRILKDLFDDGCFDKNSSVKAVIQSRILYYQNNYSLEELGIDNEAPLIGLTTLVELIQPELKLIELETIEKISNE